MRRLAVLILLLAAPGNAAISLLAQATGTAPGTGAGTSGPINPLGATLLLVAVGGGDVGTPVVVSDSNGNTWRSLTQRTSGVSGFQTQLFYAQDKAGGPLSLSPGDILTVSGGFYSAFSFSAWSGTSASGPSGQTGATSDTSTIQPGAVIPHSPGALIVSAVGGGVDSIASIDSGLTILNNAPLTGGINYSFAWAYTIGITAAPQNPTWTLSSHSTSHAAALAVFEAASNSSGSAQSFILL